MITEEQIDDVKGRMLVDPHGERLGFIDSVFLDVDNDEPLFAVVRVEDRAVLVPLTQADRSGHDVVVPYSPEQVERAPDFEEQDELTPDVERESFEHYGLTVAPRTS